MSPAASRTGDDDIGVAADMPVTVVGGYLGSGKTTLVNHLLRTATERVAVLVNDFGDVDVDADLIERDDGEVMALANGCICCSLVDGLASALVTIAEFEPRPDRLVIEASGVADPASVAAYGHGPGFELDAVVVLVDAATIRSQAADKYIGDTVRGQLRAADVLVVNKVDLVDDGRAAAVTGWLGELVDRALVVEASRARVDPAVLFGRLGDRSPADDAGARSTTPSSHAPADEVYESWTWMSAAPLGGDAIEQLMASLPDAVVRAKGIVRLDGVERPQVVQRVGGRWTMEPARVGSGAAAAATSRLVVIGRRGAIDDAWLAWHLGAPDP
ncbi:MAG: GTP-binding protein [Actinomycetota bacterium]